ncbi:hypothetical protein LZ30DRAFT_690156 [Colletotrichum cereale]|nr:hypothetical protein LZ30DRAFT_690156 [Colletotrichum cereale]
MPNQGLQVGSVRVGPEPRKTQDCKTRSTSYHAVRHMFGSCGLCMDILRMLGGRELRVDLKDTSLDTLRRRLQETLQQSSLPGAESPHVTPNGFEPKGEHGECKTSSNTTTWNNQALDDNSISEMFTDQPCACLEFSPTPKSADITGPDHRNFAESSHSRFDYATEGNVDTNSQQEFSISGHFEDAIGPNQQYQIDFDSMEMSWWEEMSSEHLAYGEPTALPIVTALSALADCDCYYALTLFALDPCGVGGQLWRRNDKNATRRFPPSHYGHPYSEALADVRCQCQASEPVRLAVIVTSGYVPVGPERGTRGRQRTASFLVESAWQ